MSNLLKGHFYKYFKTSNCKVLFILSCVLSFVIYVSVYFSLIVGLYIAQGLNQSLLDYIRNDTTFFKVGVAMVRTLVPTLFSLSAILYLVSILVFLFSDYSQGTLRNQVISGHSRKNIFYSYIFFVFIALTIVYGVYVLGTTVFNLALGGGVESFKYLTGYTIYDVCKILSLIYLSLLAFATLFLTVFFGTYSAWKSIVFSVAIPYFVYTIADLLLSFLSTTFNSTTNMIFCIICTVFPLGQYEVLASLAVNALTSSITNSAFIGVFAKFITPIWITTISSSSAIILLGLIIGPLGFKRADIK